MEAYSKDTYFMNILKQVEAETRILQSKEHIQHGTTTVYEHCVQVAYESYLFAKEHQLQVEMEQLIRGALLHDYFLYDWHIKRKGHHFHAASSAWIFPSGCSIAECQHGCGINSDRA